MVDMSEDVVKLSVPEIGGIGALAHPPERGKLQKPPQDLAQGAEEEAPEAKGQAKPLH